MSQIAPIYFNDLGISFFWQDRSEENRFKVQLVFKETGFYFDKSELATFSNLIEDACQRSNSCACCQHRIQCEKFLLKTPVAQIDLAVNLRELRGIKDLVGGTIFKMELHDFLNGIGRN